MIYFRYFECKSSYTINLAVHYVCLHYHYVCMQKPLRLRTGKY